MRWILTRFKESIDSNVISFSSRFSLCCSGYGKVIRDDHKEEMG
jgi:hypothetical protein